MSICDVNGTRLNYRLEGNGQGPVVMLSNSLAADLTMWRPQMDALTGAGYRVLRYDGRGHGQSDVPAGPYSMETLASDAVGLLDALGFDAVHFCGLSMGGMVGQVLGAHHSERLLSLSLCSTAAHLPARDVWDERIHTVRGRGMGAVVDATIDRWITAAGRERLEPEVNEIRRMILTTPVEGFCACCEAIRDMDLRDSLGAVSVPTLVVVGEEDPGTPVSAAELIHQGIASSELQVVPDAAHFLQVEQAEIFTRTLLEFIGRHAAL